MLLTKKRNISSLKKNLENSKKTNLANGTTEDTIHNFDDKWQIARRKIIANTNKSRV